MFCLEAQGGIGMTFFRSFGVLVCFFLCVLQAAGLEAKKVVVISSYRTQPYQQAQLAFCEQLKQAAPGATVDVAWLEGDAAKVGTILQEAKPENTDLYLTLGTLATRTVSMFVRSVPVVYALVVSQADLQDAPNVTGVVLEYPPEIHFALMKRIVPGRKRVGVIYSQEQNQKKVATATVVAKKMGLTLDVVRVESPEEIPGALNALVRRVDVLWGLTDSVVFSPLAAKEILLSAFRNRLALAGPSPMWTKAGALYSMDWDYQDIGIQSATLALKLLKGESVSALAPETPRKVAYSINLPTAEHVNVQLSEEVIKGAREVVRSEEQGSGGG